MIALVLRFFGAFFPPDARIAEARRRRRARARDAAWRILWAIWAMRNKLLGYRPAAGWGEQAREAYMAIMHYAVRPVQRSKGQSATRKAGYIAGEALKDEQSGKLMDYTRRKGIVHKEILLPAGCPAMTRAELWNAAEAAEKRKDGTPLTPGRP